MAMLQTFRKTRVSHTDFVVQTRRIDLLDQETQDSRQLELRDKPSQSFREISGAAQDVGVQLQVYLTMPCATVCTGAADSINGAFRLWSLLAFFNILF